MTTKKKKEQRKVILRLKTELDSQEKSEIGLELATLNQQRSLYEDEKKEVSASYTAKIKRCNSQINEKSTTLANGFEMREVECTKTLDSPRKGWVQIHRKDTGAKVEERPMTPEESQSLLALDIVNEPKKTKEQKSKEREVSKGEVPPEANDAPPSLPSQEGAEGTEGSGLKDGSGNPPNK